MPEPRREILTTCRPPRHLWTVGEFLSRTSSFKCPEPYQIPANGTIEYLHWLVPSGFKTDKWVQFAEARPGDRTRVHHIIAFIREPGSNWLKDAKPGIPFVPE